MQALPIRAHTHPSLLTWSAGAALALVLAASSATAGGVHIGHWTDDKHDPDGFQYALIQTGSETTCSVNGGRAWNDIEQLQNEVEKSGREVLWFSIRDKAYVVRDPGAIRRAREIVRPMTDLGKQQGELGRQQGELGRRQGELGAFQGRLGAMQGRVAALQATRDPETRREVAELRQQLAELSAEVRALGQRQRVLGDRQRVLGDRQRVLGQRQAAASRLAHEQLRALAETSIRNGDAERL